MVSNTFLETGDLSATAQAVGARNLPGYVDNRARIADEKSQMNREGPFGLPKAIIRK